MHEVDGKLREVAYTLADSGRCEDFLDVEMELLARGHSPAAARQVTSDEDIRASLNQRCSQALRHKD
ncbi:MAG: hypothetical protein JO055_05030 [Alphaproteobacteria bacterium]|nr:hypothetical protein [Alphaproteobacteria bacterium]